MLCYHAETLRLQVICTAAGETKLHVIAVTLLLGAPECVCGIVGAGWMKSGRGLWVGVVADAYRRSSKNKHTWRLIVEQLAGYFCRGLSVLRGDMA